LKQLMRQYDNPKLQELTNGFLTWLTVKVSGRLPAPAIRLIGSSEELWPVLFQTNMLTTGGGDLDEWLNNCDACAFPYLQMLPDGPARLPLEAKPPVLKYLFPFWKDSFLRSMIEFDAAVFLRVSKTGGPRQQLLTAAIEATHVCAVWTQIELDLSAVQVASRLNGYLHERDRVVRTKH